MTTETLLEDGDGKKHPAEYTDSLRKFKWKELMSRVDANRFYIKLILGVNAFFYATTGAVLLFYLNQENSNREFFLLLYPSLHDNYREFFLLLPIVMGTVVGGFLIYATGLQKHNSQIIEEIQLGLGIEDIPDVKLLDRLLLVFGILFFIVAGSISLVPWLRSANSLPSRPLGPHIGLLVFTFAGVAIVSAGFSFSCWKRCKYLEKTKEKRDRLKTRSGA